MISNKIRIYIETHFTGQKKKEAFKRAETLKSRGIKDENLIIDLLSVGKAVPRRLPAEMYDKVNYMCRRYMDRIARFELDYDFIPDTEAFKHTIIALFEASPVFHSRFIDNHINPYWQVCDYHIDDVLSVIHTENMIEESDKFLLRDIDLNSNVQMRIAIIICGEKSKISFAWNHMLMDGGGFKQFIDDLFRNHNEYVRSGKMPLDFRTGSRSYKEVYNDFPEADKKAAKKLFANVSSKDRHCLPFNTNSKETKKYIVRKRIGSNIFNAAKAKAKEHGASVNDLVASAYISAFYKISGCPDSEGVGISCAVDLRRYIKNPDLLGYTNHTNFFPCSISRKGSSAVETLTLVSESIAKMKQDKFMGLHGIPLLNLGYSTMVYAQAELIVGIFYNNANLAVSNVGKIDCKKFSLESHSPIDATVAGAAKKMPCAMMTVLSVNNELSMTICTECDEKSKAMLDSFLNEIENYLIEIAQ